MLYAVVVALLATVITLVGCSTKPKAQPTATATQPVKAPDAAVLPPNISVAQAYEKYQKGVYFLDVRTQSEWDAVHIPKATLIPLDELPNRLSEVPKDQEIVVVCRSGNRSQKGRDILKQAGFTQVISMDGGVNAWKSAGYPVEGNSP
jgi:rhodanese-related sulfurtransferase